MAKTLYRKRVVELTNRVKNPSFENGVTGCIAGAPVGSAGLQVLNVTTSPQVGTKAASAITTSLAAGGDHVAVINGGSAPITNGAPVTPNEIISVRARIYRRSGTANLLTLMVHYYDAAGASMGAFTVGGAGSVPTISNPVIVTWYDLFGTHTVPAGAAYAAVRSQMSGIPTSGAAEVYTDANQIVGVSDITTFPFYFDGARTNLVNNPTAETDMTGIGGGWPAGAAPGGATGGTTTRITSDGHRGSTCFETSVTSQGTDSTHVSVINGGSAPITNGAPVIPGQLVSLRAAVKPAKGTGNALVLAASFYDSAGNTLSSTTVGGAGSRGSVTVVNRASNPSAADDLTGMQGTTSGTGMSVTRVTNDGFLGETTCVQSAITAGTTGGFVGFINAGLTPVANAVPVIPGQIVSFRAAAKRVSGTGNLELWARYYDAAGAFVAHTIVTGVGAQGIVTSPTTGEWYELWGTHTAPTNAAFASLRIVLSGTTGPSESNIPASMRATAMQVALVSSTTDFPAYDPNRRWNELYGTITVPTNAAYAAVRANWNGNAAGQPAAIRADAMQLIVVTSDTDYPAYIENARNPYAWSGAAHASSSVKYGKGAQPPDRIAVTLSDGDVVEYVASNLGDFVVADEVESIIKEKPGRLGGITSSLAEAAPV